MVIMLALDVLMEDNIVELNNHFVKMEHGLTGLDHVLKSEEIKFLLNSIQIKAHIEQLFMISKSVRFCQI